MRLCPPFSKTVLDLSPERTYNKDRRRRNKRLASLWFIQNGFWDPEKPSLRRVAVFLMGLTNHDRNRKRSDVKGNPHKTSPPFGDVSQPLFTVALASSAPLRVTRVPQAVLYFTKSALNCQSFSGAGNAKRQNPYRGLQAGPRYGFFNLPEGLIPFTGGAHSAFWVRVLQSRFSQSGSAGASAWSAQ